MERFDPVDLVLPQEHIDTGSYDTSLGYDTAGQIFQTWSYESDRQFSLDALRQMVRRELPESIYRCKGIVYAADFPDKRFALQAVGRRTELSELDNWGDRTPYTHIVAIGSSFDPQQLNRKFDECIKQ